MVAHCVTLAAMAGAPDFWQYYRRVTVQIWQDISRHVLATVLALLSVTAGTILLAMYRVNPPSQTWTRTALGAAWPLAIFVLYLLWYAVRAPWRIHLEDRATHSRELQAAIDSVTALRERLATSDEQYEEARKQLSLRLLDPVLHFEPENGTVSNAGSPCNFVITIVNTGLEDVDRLQVFVTYFVAQRSSGSIVLKEVGYGSYIPAVQLAELKSKDSALIRLDFSALLPIMKEVGANGGRDVPYVFGVKLHARFRRRTDGRDFEVIACYGSDVVTGHALYTPHPFRLSMPEELKQVLTLDEVVQYLNSSDHWVGVVTEISANPDGSLSRKNR